MPKPPTASTSPQSLIIVGGGIVGLCMAAVARARGHAVTVVVRDAAEHTASGVAAGMVAPALEALNESNPPAAFTRLKRAEAAWWDLFGLWPKAAQDLLAAAQWHTSLYVTAGSAEASEAGLLAMGTRFSRLGWDDVLQRGFDPESQSMFALADDWLVEAAPLLAALREGLSADATAFFEGTVVALEAGQVRLQTGEILAADHVIVAAGYGARRFADTVPSLAALRPIRGHLLDVPGLGTTGIVRSADGYYAGYGDNGKFGASMEFGRDDLAIESTVVEDLKIRAATLLPALDLSHAVPRVGIRAATPDGWPLIGRDVASGVWMATGMRRNGFVFAPFAAKLLLAMLAGEAAREDASAYDPNRFLSGH